MSSLHAPVEWRWIWLVAFPCFLYNFGFRVWNDVNASSVHAAIFETPPDFTQCWEHSGQPQWWCHCWVRTRFRNEPLSSSSILLYFGHCGHIREFPPPAGQVDWGVRREAVRGVWEGWRYDLLGEGQVCGHRAVRSVLPNWVVWRTRGWFPSGWRRCSQDMEYLGNICRSSDERWRTPFTTARTCPNTRCSFVRRGMHPLYSASGNWRMIKPLVCCESGGEGTTRVHRNPLLLRRSNFRKGANRAEESENITLL